MRIRNRVKTIVTQGKEEHWQSVSKTEDNTVGYNTTTEAFKTIKNIRCNRNKDMNK